jgi:hypothetical protein
LIHEILLEREIERGGERSDNHMMFDLLHLFIVVDSKASKRGER